MSRLLLCLALALSCVHSLVVERQGRQSTVKKGEQPPSECDVTLEESGTINGVELCDRAPDDPSKYANKADWNFRYSNNRDSACWINIQYRVDIEDSRNCDRDSLAFGGSTDPERMVLCGQRTGAFSIPVGPRDTFTIRFKSDYSVAGAGFLLYYNVGARPAFPVADEPRTLSNPTSTISPTPTQYARRSDFSEYVYPEYADYYPEYPRRFQAYQYYNYPDYQNYYPKASQGYNQNPDTYYPQYQRYPVNTGAYYPQYQYPRVKTGGLDDGSQHWYGSPQTNYQYRQFARARREATDE